jgi:hypothetical protein
VDVVINVLAGGIAIILLLGVMVTLISCRIADRDANKRAEALLRRHLSETERAQLQRQGVLNVASRVEPGRVYQVRANSGRVLVLQDSAAVMELCVRPRALLPGNEHVLAHKLMIEAAEDEYMRQANVMWRAGQATVFGATTLLD